MKKLLTSKDVVLVSAYKSKNDEFRRMPPELTVSLPSFTPQSFSKDQLHEQFGVLSTLSFTKEEYGYRVDSPATESFPQERQLIDVPQIITELAPSMDYAVCLVRVMTKSGRAIMIMKPSVSTTSRRN